MPITHYYLGKEWVEQCTNYTYEEKTAFLIGTLYPDIRYLAKVPREQTHPVGVTLEDVVTAPPFQAGAKFHVFIDNFRAPIVEKHLLNAHYQFVKRHDTFIKIIEDGLLESRIDRSKAARCLQLFHIDEFELPSNLVEKWHMLVTKYIHLGAEKGITVFSGGLAPETYNQWSELYGSAIQGEIFQAYINDFLESFNHAITPYRCSKQ